MKITTGTVVAGKIVMEGDPFPEGSTVTVFASEGDGFFELGPREEEELLAAIAEADAGDVIDGEEFWRELRGRRA
ncbi:MAG TPA: hypothetical protein VGH73_16980 [Thermoanaerobaculia bacterium]|jgi:hypothetical protein